MAETVAITGLGHTGDGVAETEGGRLFVPYTLPGETVTIERGRGDHARLVDIITPSPDRVEPLCRHFGVCGGCALQHMARESYLAWKRRQVETAFAQRGIAAPVEPVVAVPPGSRRRAIFSAVRTQNEIVFGLNRRGSDEVFNAEECPVLVPAISSRLQRLAGIARAALKPGRRVRVTVIAADNGLDIAIDGAGPPGRGTIEALASPAGAAEVARLTVGGEEVFRLRTPEISLGHASIFPPPGGFIQAAAAAERAMAEAVEEGAGADGSFADLFAGVGTFALRLARRGSVLAVEGDAAAVAAIDSAARRAKRLKAISVRRRGLFRNPLAPEELRDFAAVVFDPPRAGAKAQAAALAASAVPRVIAVSCNPATLARDARTLVDGGYRLKRVLPIDQFVFSAEIEAVATFER
jgi:23S rRNA (uracil1939-C5)-methyltransferase